MSFVDELPVHSHQNEKIPTAYLTRDDLVLGLRSCLRQRYIIFLMITNIGIRIEGMIHGSRDIPAETF